MVVVGGNLDARSSALGFEGVIWRAADDDRPEQET
jgi:hypothetical protein